MKLCLGIIIFLILCYCVVPVIFSLFFSAIAMIFAILGMTVHFLIPLMALVIAAYIVFLILSLIKNLFK